LNADTAPETPDEPEIFRLSILGLFVGFIAGLPRLFFPLVAVLFGSSKVDRSGAFLPAIIAGVLALSLLARWIAWTRFRYFTGAEDIRIESGLISRNARSIPYDRIQDVSIEQKPLARIFGLGEVKFESGSGTGDEATLSYVDIAEAERLRELVRMHKTGTGQASAIRPAADAQEDAPVFAMDLRRVLTLGFYSFSLVIFAVLGGAAQQFDFLLPFDIYDIGAWLGLAKDNGNAIGGIGLNTRILAAAIALLALIMIGFATGIIRTLLREYGFRLDITPRGFRRRRGMLTLTDTVMPVHRVQAATIQTGPIRKRRGWYALKFVSLAADTGTKQGEDSDHAAAPLASMAEIGTILDLAGIDRPAADLAFNRGRAGWWLVHFAAIFVVNMTAMAALVFAADAGWKPAMLLLVPLLGGCILYFRWQRTSYAFDTGQLFVRSGWWRERLVIAPQVKIQTAEIMQGPIARWQGLASVQLGIAGGTLEIVALPVDAARRIQAQIVGVIARVDYSRTGLP
jgi:putative membrane protein